MLLYSLACSSPSRLATVPGGLRLAELANGEILVTAESGEVWLADAYGGARRIALVSDERLAEAVADPSGRYWIRTASHQVYTGSPWAPPSRVADSSALIIRTCEETRWTEVLQQCPGATAIALGGSCSDLICGTALGSVGSTKVSESPITRVQQFDAGVLWVDADGHAGCLGCIAPVPETNVKDAVSMHLAPFVLDEVVWLDMEGRLWSAPS